MPVNPFSYICLYQHQKWERMLLRVNIVVCCYALFVVAWFSPGVSDRFFSTREGVAIVLFSDVLQSAFSPSLVVQAERKSNIFQVRMQLMQ